MANLSTIRGDAIKRWTAHYGSDCPTINSNSNRSKSNGKRNVAFPSGVIFLAASQSGDIDETLQLLRNGADPNSSTADGLTAHHQCCIDGNLEMLRSLVDHGADVNAKDNEGWTPLHAAASCDQSEIVSYLIEHGADVSLVNADGQIPQDLCDEDNDCLVLLQNAARDSSIDLDRARNHERDVMMKDAVEIRDNGMPASANSLKFGATPLHVASAKGYDDVVEVLLDAGLDVNRPDDDGWTPLHAAAHWKQDRACELLSDYGADFDAVSKLGQTCIEVADSDISDKLLQLKRAQPKKPTIVRKPVKIVPAPLEAPATTAEATPPSRVESPKPTSASPIETPATTAQTTPPSSTSNEAFDRRQHGEGMHAESSQQASGAAPKLSSGSQESCDQPMKSDRSPSVSSQVIPDALTNEPETKRRQKARRSRETRRVTQHIRMEDLHAAVSVGKSSTTPDITSDEGGGLADDIGATSDEGPDIRILQAQTASRAIDSAPASPRTSIPRLSDAPGSPKTPSSPSPVDAPATTAEATPSSFVESPSNRSASVSSQAGNPPDSATTGPAETKRRQKARRCRETRRVTQHVKMEDLQAASTTGKSATTPEVTSDEGGGPGDDIGATSDEGGDAHVNDTKSSSRSATAQSTSAGKSSDCATCRCPDRLKTLEKQLEGMYESFANDRNRVGALEKELKQVREENRALIRVIARLSRA